MRFISHPHTTNRRSVPVSNNPWNKPGATRVNPSIGQFGEDTMSFNVLIVEDQPLVALNLQDTIEELGHRPVGIASNMYQALMLATDADMALVDVNLEDGPTGPIVGRTLVEADVTVLFMTSDPGALRGGVPGALGVIQKPILDLELVEAIQYVADRRAGRTDIPPPKSLVEFDAV
jgi:CheY-like chemotaxis protein